MSDWGVCWAEAKQTDILAIAERLGAKLKRAGAHWIGPCPLDCARRDGFIITPAKSIFLCRPSGATGDAVNMAEHVLGISRTDALAFVLQRNLPGSRDETPQERDARQARNAQWQAKREEERRKAEAEERLAAAKTQRLIEDIIRNLAPVRGSPGERYLGIERGIDTDAIADVLDRVDAIGWHSGVRFYETNHPLNGEKLGCIVGIMTDPITALPTGAISRTYLDPEGRKVGKAKTLGRPAGIVRLSEDADVLRGLYIAEGKETALAAMSKGVRPIWATGSTALMENFPVLPVIEWLTILVDHDANRAGEEAARACERRWLDAGREVRLRRPKQFGDFNDVLMRETQ